MSRESMSFDVIIVGAGPAGLSAAIRLKQLAQQQDKEITVCVLEKGAEVGAHILSGAVLEPRALNELLPNWQKLDAPLSIAVKDDKFLFLTEKKAYKLPTPPQMRNRGNYIISLGLFCRWLAEQAEALGVDIYPGFPATEVLYDDSAHVIGVATGDMGINKNGEPGANYQAGMNLYAKQTIFAEGCRGSLTKTLIDRFYLDKDTCPQTYGLGIKELWQVEPEQHQPGLVMHSIGWPLKSDTYGGSFIYHLADNNKVAAGFVIGLDYKNPYLNPFEEFQRFKTHPNIRNIFINGERLAYGARAVNEGGLQSIPKLIFPGGLLVGCAAGFLNVAKIKGTHMAMKSGMLAADNIFPCLTSDKPVEVKKYLVNVQRSWVWHELFQVRNIRPAFRWGLYLGLLYSAIDTYIFRGKAPWTFKHHYDHESCERAYEYNKINYPKPDGKLTFDRLSSVYLSGTQHQENQPCHLQLKDPHVVIETNLVHFDAPEQRYCPAGVYEILTNSEGKPYLQINAQNCIHCKTCDIKDFTQNINWVPPEGGGGPNYQEM